MQESLYHGVPVVGVPIFLDQGDNARRVEDRAVGRIIWNRRATTAEDVYEAVSDVVKNGT